MTHATPRTSWLLACLLPSRNLESAIGDLEEEFQLRSRSLPQRSASRWYWGQIVRSVPWLLWASVRRGEWFGALGAAVGVAIIQVMIEVTTKSAIQRFVSPDADVAAWLATLVVILPSLVLLSYFAARIRPGAPAVLAGLIVIAVVVDLVVKAGTSNSLWHPIAVFIAGPSASVAGGALSARKQS